MSGGTMAMNEDRLGGTAKSVGGQVEEGFGRATGDVKTQVQGKARQMEGTLQEVYGQAKETAAEAAEAIREAGGEAGDFLRTTIEQRPYTTAAVALGIGYLIGRFGQCGRAAELRDLLGLSVRRVKRGPDRPRCRRMLETREWDHADLREIGIARTRSRVPRDCRRIGAPLSAASCAADGCRSGRNTTPGASMMPFLAALSVSVSA